MVTSGHPQTFRTHRPEPFSQPSSSILDLKFQKIGSVSGNSGSYAATGGTGKNPTKEVS
jgi:hypothetical protein